jgi:hypothetical protein
MVVGNPRSTSSSKNVSEQIDARILRLLGLEDVFDLDYETYITLLKEILVKSVVTGKNKLANEEVNLLKDELKRVKGRGKTGRFKVKEKKVSASKIKNVTAKITNNNYILNQSTNVISPQKLLPAGGTSVTAAEVTDKSKTLGDEFENNISAIRKSVESIANILGEQLKFQLKSRENERKDSESRRRGARESALEKPLKVMKKVIDGILAPVKSIWEKILNFFVQTLLGRIVFKLVDWFANPENARKIRSLIRFFGDWWPALLGAYILFGTSFGKFTSSILGIVGSGLLRLTKFAIPQLLRFIKSPLGIATGLFTAGATIPMLFPETVDEQERKVSQAPGSNAEKIKELQKQKDALSWFEKLQGKGSEIDEQISKLKTGETKSYGFSGGGWSGLVAGQKGTDKIPAMLTDGEFVMSAGAVRKYGVDTLESMNAAGGGNNKPREISGTVYAQGGGYVGFDGEGLRSGGNNLKSIVDEIVKQLSPHYNWAKNLAIKNGISLAGSISTAGKGLQNTALNLGNSIYSGAMNQAASAQRYLNNGSLQRDVMMLGNQAYKAGSQLYSQGMNYAQNASRTLTNLDPKKPTSNALSSIQRATSSKEYQSFSERTNKIQDRMISFGDKFIKKLPDGPFKEMADKGLIPIPTGNATNMRNLTFLKALLGPVGKPFKILSNKEVDAMRQKTIDLTMNKHGLMIDPKTGQVKMNWNQEDINKGQRGGGAYTDTLGKRGSSFNSTLGRFSAATEGSGNTLFSDDRYNFNKTVSEYASKAKDALLKGSMSDATYYGASMLGRFAQDIGWLNQRALGSRIQIGSVNRNTIDPKTGKPKSAQQISADQAKARQEAARLAKRRANEEKLREKRAWWDKMGWFGGGSKVAQEQARQAQIAKKATPKPSSTTKPPSPPKPKVTVVRPTAGGGMNGGRSSRNGGSATRPPAIQAQSSRRTSNSRATHGIK